MCPNRNTKETGMKKKKSSFAFRSGGMLTAVLYCCGGGGHAQDVHYNFAQGTDFNKYKTYKLVEAPGNRHPNQILDGQIKQAIEMQLATKGLVMTDNENADLYVT